LYGSAAHQKTGGSRFLELKSVFADRLVPVCFFVGRRPRRQTFQTLQKGNPLFVVRCCFQTGGDQPAIRHLLFAGKSQQRDGFCCGQPLGKELLGIMFAAQTDRQ
jgi:hypothetical protein